MMIQICTLLDTPFLKTVSDLEFPGCRGGMEGGGWRKTSCCFWLSSILNVFRTHFPFPAKSPLSVPRSKSEMNYIDGEKVVKRSATLPLPARSSSLKSSPERNDWEPPDKKVDTRKYRAEPKSIYEYQPGRSSVLTNEKMVMCILKFFCLTLPMFLNPDALCTWITFFLPWGRLALFRRQWKNEVFLPISFLQVFITYKSWDSPLKGSLLWLCCSFCAWF